MTGVNESKRILIASILILVAAAALLAAHCWATRFVIVSNGIWSRNEPYPSFSHCYAYKLNRITGEVWLIRDQEEGKVSPAQ